MRIHEIEGADRLELIGKSFMVKIHKGTQNNEGGTETTEELDVEHSTLIGFEPSSLEVFREVHD